jgi:hypothetical protein
VVITYVYVMDKLTHPLPLDELQLSLDQLFEVGFDVLENLDPAKPAPAEFSLKIAPTVLAVSPTTACSSDFLLSMKSTSTSCGGTGRAQR